MNEAYHPVVARYKAKISHLPPLSNLKQKIQLGRKERQITKTLESLEIYEGCKFSLDIGYVLDDPKEWAESHLAAAQVTLYHSTRSMKV